MKKSIKRAFSSRFFRTDFKCLKILDGQETAKRTQKIVQSVQLSITRKTRSEKSLFYKGFRGILSEKCGLLKTFLKNLVGK